MVLPARPLPTLLFPGLAAIALLVPAPPLLAQSATTSRAASRAEATSPEKVSPSPPPPSPYAERKQDLQVTLSADGRTVYVVGMILEGSFHKFDEVLRGAPGVRTVYLSSAGGYTIEARLMAALVRKRKLDTYAGFYCASACTQIFVAGRNRVLGPDGYIGFHQAVTVSERGLPGRVRPRTDRPLTSTTVFGVNGNDTLRLAYELAGVDAAFIDKALSYSHENMWLPPAAELLSARVITRQAAAPELSGPPGGTGPRDEVRARLLQSPLWRAALARMPSTTEDAVSEVWRGANSGLTLTEATEAGRTRLIVAVTKGMIRAPDAILERSLALYASSARDQKARGYPACQVKLGTVLTATAPEDLEFQRQEDALATDFLMTPDRVARMDGSAATTLFAREVVPRLAGAFRGSNTAGGKCRLGYRTFEVIDGLPKKNRLKAYRALLSLPGMADVE